MFWETWGGRGHKEEEEKEKRKKEKKETRSMKEGEEEEASSHSAACYITVYTSNILLQDQRESEDLSCSNKLLLFF